MIITAQIDPIINPGPIAEFSGSDVNEIPPRLADFLQGLEFSVPNIATDRDHDEGYGSNITQSVSQAKEALEFSEMISNRFWGTWTTQYLTALGDNQKRHLKVRHKRNVIPKTGEIVFVEQELIPCGGWIYDRVVEIIQSKDGQIRTIKLLTPSGRTLQRPLNKFNSLEISSDTSSMVNSPVHKEYFLGNMRIPSASLNKVRDSQTSLEELNSLHFLNRRRELQNEMTSLNQALKLPYSHAKTRDTLTPLNDNTRECSSHRS
ncbi:hypothetical protein RB195_023996 [Necator americanus]|uniref:DUF5641 domain-containing protein n=1 Tax=Necator americanus TaxID=51031 RepID=A0ABR1ELW0_NECAM